ncbi:complement factor I-like [Maniola jurtina]|uniref:complement factor I-like n=1 Tax=Maniola jurtina TaxID=191418 RepID=UPI001E687717|nr:complement factor I-like [Maniola jurtina]
MKALLVILVICTLYLTLDCANELRDTKIAIRTYPKKVNTTLQKGIQLVNSKKFGKLGKYGSHKAKIKKSLVKNNTYTAFPPFAERKINDVPESINFQGNADRKTRVKKVLPDYGIPFLRRKRSAAAHVNTTGIGKATENNKNVKRRKINKKRIKRKGLNKNTNNSSLKRNKAKSKTKVIKGKVPYVIKKTKKRNINATKLRTVKRGKKRLSRNLKYTKTKNHTKFLYPGRDQIGPKKPYARNPKQDRRVTREQEKKVRNRRLIAGRDAMIQDYPYVVSIQKDNRHWCAGALLNPRLVITTANCVWKSKRISRMRVRAGSRHMDRGGQLVKIQEVVKHPRWSIRTLPDNDVALLLLNKNIKFSDSVHGVDLPNRAMWPAFEDVWVTSWGAERRDGIFKSVGVTLQVYHAMLMDHDKCNNVTMRFGVVVSHNFICVAQTGRRAPCTRDTGAPAVSDGILWGLASWGIRKLCGTERYPAMFSYLASRSNLDFITNATHYLMSDKRYYPYGDRFVIDRTGPTETPATVY